MTKVSNNFLLVEWVPKVIYDRFGESSIRFLDPKTIQAAQRIRERWGKSMLINDWHKGDEGYNFNFRGYRPPECGLLRWIKRQSGEAALKKMLAALPSDQQDYLTSVDFGSWWSAHKQGKAFDYNISGVPAEEVYEDIIKNQAWYLSIGVTRIEDISIAKTWSHNDTLTTNLSEVAIILP